MNAIVVGCWCGVVWVLRVFHRLCVNVVYDKSDKAARQFEYSFNVELRHRRLGLCLLRASLINFPAHKYTILLNRIV